MEAGSLIYLFWFVGSYSALLSICILGSLLEEFRESYRVPEIKSGWPHARQTISLPYSHSGPESWSLRDNLDFLMWHFSQGTVLVEARAESSHSRARYSERPCGECLPSSRCLRFSQYLACSLEKVNMCGFLSNFLYFVNNHTIDY